uniref:Uncharacterized protein n=1 Tax=Vibrio parahaemolyticus TaxID=670 RepID=A0A7M1VZH2_VIBPH|nr:hypothetical protein VP383_00020 [Vibrio parahaemolyticus]QOS16572.1 hypothetical protein VP410_00020 [Vibrio parahaemolyticus]QOS18167.1 hypothetical protein VP437_00020 [Vibrio parahaemolyticus]QOS18460.1 hypothetical protein VP417_00020 [Vibrio parahaemolyticus]QOS18632.1 hypothetical protein VP435_00020 [Vibrio parahaemolyticus]
MNKIKLFYFHSLKNQRVKSLQIKLNITSSSLINNRQDSVIKTTSKKNTNNKLYG